MNVSPIRLNGAVFEGVYACLPPRTVDNLAFCRACFGDEDRAQSVVKATGIKTRRVAADGVTPAALSCAAAHRLLEDAAQRQGLDCAAFAETIGAVIDVSFTRPDRMPAESCQAQARLGLPASVAAFDVSLACSGYVYALYLAALMLPSLGGKRVLILDGDVQTPFLPPNDTAAAPVLSDAGTATLLAPASPASVWPFAFHTVGAEGAALQLGTDNQLRMDGFGVFRFVSTEVTDFLRAFLASVQVAPESVGAFVPHQANVYMITQLAAALKIPAERLLVSAERVGNPSSASIPVTLAGAANQLQREGPLCLAGFGGGLSAAACVCTWNPKALVASFDYDDERTTHA